MAAPEPIVIRRALPGDATELAAIRIASIRGVCATTGLYTPDEVERWIGDRPISDFERLIVDDATFAAHDALGGTLVGFGRVQAPRPDAADPAWWVKGLFIRPERIARGIGRRLLATLLDAAKERGATRVDLVATLNAEAFYLKNGFTAQARVQHTTATGAVIPGIKMTRVIEP